MTDLLFVLPAFPTQDYTHLIPSLEKNLVTTTDLLTLDAVEIAKRAQLPLLDIKRLCRAVLHDLQGTLGVANEANTDDASRDKIQSLIKNGNDVVESWSVISTLDKAVDAVLGGGIPTGYITEITGESGVGKTQFLIGLLLATQLSSPHGLSKAALYVSTESGLPTTRLSQMLLLHPTLASAETKPSLDRIISIVTPDLESQDHILRYQLPVAIRRHNIGLVVLDSVAANYRAEFERPGMNRNGAHMAKRSSELINLGQLLRDLARTENIAIVVANQVADRFAGSETGRMGYGDIRQTQSSPLTHRSVPLHPQSSIKAPESSLLRPKIPTPRASGTEVMSLDHQQRWFTGWGDDPLATDAKTPSLGLVWTAQIACRIALLKSPIYEDSAERDERERLLKGWRRWLKVVFAPWASPTGMGSHGAVEFEITGAGIRSLGNGIITDLTPDFLDC